MYISEDDSEIEFQSSAYGWVRRQIIPYNCAKNEPNGATSASQLSNFAS